jgi:putative DNA primase/helicase
MKQQSNGIGILVEKIAMAVCTTEHFAQDVGGKLYRYVDGVYQPRADKTIKKITKRCCQRFAQQSSWSPRLAEHVAEFIRVDAPELWERPPIEVVNVANGLLNLRTRELLPHSPEHRSPIQLPVSYDPSATCPVIDKFVAEVFPSDAIDLAYEIHGWLMVPYTSIQKAILLLGEGGNGKSTFLTMLTAFLGRHNTSAVSLHRLESQRFSVARLVGRLANICADLPSEHLSGTSIFKAITGGDTVDAERKFCEGFEFEPYSRLVFSANSPPRSQDSSDGFFDRWCVVPFDRRIRGTGQEIPKAELDARLSAPSELSGLLNRAVEGWHRIQVQGRLTESESVRAAWQQFHAATDPLSVWLDQFTIDDPQATVPKAVLRAAYGAACERAGRTAPTDKAFSVALLRHRPRVAPAQRVVNGRKQWCYLGVGLSGGPESASQVSQDSQDNPPLF